MRVSHGPWKFNGLPGLILEVKDSKEVVTIVATKIAAGKDMNCDIEIDQSSLNTVMNLPEYLEQKEELIDEVFAKLSSKLKKGNSALIRNKNWSNRRSSISFDVSSLGDHSIFIYSRVSASKRSAIYALALCLLESGLM